MTEISNPSILSHVSLGTNRFAEAVAFYDKVLATLGPVHAIFDDAKLPGWASIDACAEAQTGCLRKKHNNEWGPAR